MAPPLDWMMMVHCSNVVHAIEAILRPKAVFDKPFFYEAQEDSHAKAQKRKENYTHQISNRLQV
ncbi:MAG: hypothetical protein C4530_17600 [Desulfobacteraceae bacterium]|nr:MAG: hypothetical protein C4530_17600 [Desulfobacteraceae bacterium]